MRLMKILFKASIKSQAQYRFDFIVSIIGNFLGMIPDFLILAFLLMRFKTLGEWDLYQVALVFGIIEFGFGVYRFFGDSFNKFEDYIIGGKLDALLIRPAPVITQVILQKMDFKRLGMVIQALVVGYWGYTQVTFTHNTGYYYIPLLLIASSIFNLFMGVIFASTAFWTGRNKDIIILGHYASRNAAEYPGDIFHAFFKKILIYVLPFYTISYLPLSYLTGKTDNPWVLLTPLYGVMVTGGLAYFVWSKGLKRYSSTGT